MAPTWGLATRGFLGDGFQASLFFGISFCKAKLFQFNKTRIQLLELSGIKVAEYEDRIISTSSPELQFQAYLILELRLS